MEISRKETSALHWGGVATVDWHAANKLIKYDFAVKSELSKNFMLGFKHISTTKDAIKPGKLMFYFFNQTAINRFATEWTYDW